MKRYSEQAKLLRECADSYEKMKCDLCTQKVLREAADTIEKLSAEKVKCVECRYFTPWDDTCGGCAYLSNSEYQLGVSNWFYCADGERADK